MDNNIDLETLWNDLLSRESRKVQRAFSRLDKESQQAVLQHLTRMSVEAGWHSEQRISAKAALKALALDE
jgi:hypothetical protein